ncbi:MAG: NusG domain II-containing protein [Hungatella sp.]
MTDKKKNRDLLLVLGILILAGGLYLGNLLLFRQPASIVEITVDGTVINRLDLKKDTDLIIPGAGGGTNHLVIRSGEVCIIEASCPDKVCVRQGGIHQTGEMIVCLPNLMIAKIVDQ